MTVIESIPAKENNKLLIVGDLIIDETWLVKTKKISPEAPVPVAFLTKPTPDRNPGGGGFAAAYAAKYDIPATFATAYSLKTKDWLKQCGIEVHGYNVDVNVIKTRYIDIDSGYHLIRVDNDDLVANLELKENNYAGKKFFDQVINLAANCKACLFLDYKKGLLSNASLVNKLIMQLHQLLVPIYVDSRDKDLYKYKTVNWLKLNTSEFNQAKDVLQVNTPHDIIKKLDLRNGLIVTRGAEGASLYTHTSQGTCPIPNQDYGGAPDVTGCGDVFDVSFCKYLYQNEMTPHKALIASVNDATNFARQPIHNRLVK